MSKTPAGGEEEVSHRNGASGEGSSRQLASHGKTTTAMPRRLQQRRAEHGEAAQGRATLHSWRGSRSLTKRPVARKWSHLYGGELGRAVVRGGGGLRRIGERDGLQPVEHRVLDRGLQAQHHVRLHTRRATASPHEIPKGSGWAEGTYKSWLE